MLARTLGYPSRWRMYEALTAEELLEWEAIYSIDPWGEVRSETLHGILCNLVDACHRTRGSPEPPLSYMPFVKALRKPEHTIEQLKANWKAAVANWNS